MKKNICSRCCTSRDDNPLKRKLLRIKLENISLLSKERTNKVIIDDLTAENAYLKKALLVVLKKDSFSPEQVTTPKTLIEAPTILVHRNTHKTRTVFILNQICIIYYYRLHLKTVLMSFCKTP